MSLFQSEPWSSVNGRQDSRCSLIYTTALLCPHGQWLCCSSFHLLVGAVRLGGWLAVYIEASPSVLDFIMCLSNVVCCRP